ncbi:MAG TPA: TIGR03435 family protein [Bryobacteraceae bacterium]|nr:TIGR03435 family protein [Bryobacteraceae bacterium]
MVFCACAAAFAQAPAFDVASVKRITGASGGIGQEIAPASLTLRGVPLGYCIRWTYGMRPYQTWQTAGPAWIDPPRCEFYDIVAKTDTPVPVNQLRLMLQSLLAERFGLALHRESRRMPVYGLTADKGGPKLQPSSKPDSEGQPKWTGMNVYAFEGFSMAHLAEFLTTITGLPGAATPIVDETGLAGTYDFTLDIQQHRDPQPDAQGHIDTEGAVMRALPDIGLKLTPKPAPVEVLVIDRVEKQPR